MPREQRTSAGREQRPAAVGGVDMHPEPRVARTRRPRRPGRQRRRCWWRRRWRRLRDDVLRRAPARASASVRGRASRASAADSTRRNRSQPMTRAAVARDECAEGPATHQVALRRAPCFATASRHQRAQVGDGAAAHERAAGRPGEAGSVGQPPHRRILGIRRPGGDSFERLPPYTIAGGEAHVGERRRHGGRAGDEGEVPGVVDLAEHALTQKPQGGLRSRSRRRSARAATEVLRRAAAPCCARPAAPAPTRASRARRRCLRRCISCMDMGPSYVRGGRGGVAGGLGAAVGSPEGVDVVLQPTAPGAQTSLNTMMLPV